MDKNYSVYIHINKINNKKYIGITGQIPENRWSNGNGYKNNQYFWNAIQKYGWNEFYHIIIISDITKDEAEKLEINLIKYYDATNSNNGYNIQRGGNLQGLYPVFQYDRTSGKFIKEWESTISIETSLGIPNANISSVCHGKMKTSHNYYFSYKFLGNNLPEDILNWINKNDCIVKVAQYDLNGNFLKIYNSLTEASEAIANNKNSRINFKHKTSFGYIWKKSNR